MIVRLPKFRVAPVAPRPRRTGSTLRISSSLNHRLPPKLAESTTNKRIKFLLGITNEEAVSEDGEATPGSGGGGAGGGGGDADASRKKRGGLQTAPRLPPETHEIFCEMAELFTDAASGTSWWKETAR